MSAKSHENLKAIRFAGELLPNWAQLLDFPARLCPVSEEMRHWFTRLTTCAGVDDARTVIDYCTRLRAGIQEHRESIAAELRRSREDGQPAQIIGAWMYALDTMIQQAQSSRTCSWTVEGAENAVIDDSDGGDITLRRMTGFQAKKLAAPNAGIKSWLTIEHFDRYGRRAWSLATRPTPKSPANSRGKAHHADNPVLGIQTRHGPDD